jgi:hypothetical protein
LIPADTGLDHAPASDPVRRRSNALSWRDDWFFVLCRVDYRRGRRLKKSRHLSQKITAQIFRDLSPSVAPKRMFLAVDLFICDQVTALKQE